MPLPAVRSWLVDVRQDLALSCRALRQHRGLPIVAVVTLALGIGANTAIFSLAHTVLLQPLPFRDPGRLVVVWEDMSSVGGPPAVEASPANFRDWRSSNATFADMAAVSGRETFNLTGAGEPERLIGAHVTGSLFGLLGVEPVLGRVITEDDDRQDRHVAVLSTGLWTRRFGADPHVVGRTITLDDLPYTIVGVVPGSFQFPARGHDIWIPMAFPPEVAAMRTSFYLDVVARLKPGLTLEQARVDMAALARRITAPLPIQTSATVVPLREQLVGDSRTTLLLLGGIVGLVLLIACVNVAHLLLARSAGRRRDFVVRTALGASRGRLARQLLTESALLACVGAACGVWLSVLVRPLLQRLIPDAFPEGTTLALNAPVLWFTVAATALTCLLFSTWPVLSASAVDAAEAMQSRGVRTLTKSSRRARQILVVGEVAMTMVLLISAGLLLRSYQKLSAVNIGFPVHDLIVAETPLSSRRYARGARRDAFVGAVLQRVRSQPGVTAAGYVSHSPLSFPGGRQGIAIDGRPAPPPGQLPPMAINRSISPGYLQALGVPLLRGRHIDERDGAATPRIVVINETAARTLWPGGDPIGQRIRLGGARPDSPSIEVVGVVGDVHQVGLAVPHEPEVYLPIAQTVEGAGPFVWPRYLVVRTAGDGAGVASHLRAIVAAVDADQPVADIRHMDQIVDSSLDGRSMQLTLVGGLSLLALVLSAIGLYGVLAYTVAQDTPEIGLRMALGASRSGVVTQLLSRAVRLTGAGILIGGLAAIPITRLFASLLFGITATDPVAFAGVALLVLCVALAATGAPARRVTRVDPLIALRE
jgi:putative ABC transport system permease protein